MTTDSTAESDAHQNVLEAVRLVREESFDEALDLFEGSLPELTSGNLTQKRVAAAAFSYYGLCVAVVRRQYAQAVEYCNISLKRNFLDPEHRYNLAMVFLERGERRKAVETLNAGLRLQSNHKQINTILDRIGRRKRPVVPFLPRGNSLNIWLGKLLRGRKTED
jgi:tetratricopeptide (TPR) repeat protein